MVIQQHRPAEATLDQAALDAAPVVQAVRAAEARVERALQFQDEISDEYLEVLLWLLGLSLLAVLALQVVGLQHRVWTIARYAVLALSVPVLGVVVAYCFESSRGGQEVTGAVLARDRAKKKALAAGFALKSFALNKVTTDDPRRPKAEGKDL